MTAGEVLIQQLIIGLSNGMIIALIALGYTMVYGLVELINFAHGDLFMLGAFAGLTILGVAGPEMYAQHPWQCLVLMFTIVPSFCALLNWAIEHFAYRPIRNAPKMSALVSALGMSFVLMNVGLFWGGLPLDVFNGGTSAASPKDFPDLLSNDAVLAFGNVQVTAKDILVWVVTIPLLLGLLAIVQKTQFGRAMRATAQNPVAARLVGINVDSVISRTFILGGALAGAASIVYALYNNTVFFQMGYRVGIDAFTAAVLGGIGSLSGAVVGGLIIGMLRAISDQYIAAQWTNTILFSLLIAVLIFRPSGLFGSNAREKV